ncbi:TM0106 family RecB-like putative nuclease [Microlunatus speluncae]|uniref:TM0106 family RecB-like putative nuclease n=1 Tax=Microlunatus speluncae TaxID=2594267 RepID=UPI00126616C5|nr:TM0106 family RecB-like putative nuclease [Microlunatus speluncae]
MSEILLGSYAARSCAVKTHNAFDATVSQVESEPDDSLAELFDGGLTYQHQVLDRLLAACSETVLDLRALDDHPGRIRTGACAEAVAAGFPVIMGPTLPPDAEGHRLGSPDLLVRGADRADGRPGYHPVEVKWHKIIERHRPRRARPQDQQPEQRPTEPPPELPLTELINPGPQHRELITGLGLRVGNREADFLQLAHYWRMLERLGWAADEPVVAVIGTDGHPLPERDGPVLAWLRLDRPVVRTFSRSRPERWRLRTLLERYDHEFDFRVAVAETAARRTGAAGDPAPLVQPIVVDECARCQWWQTCLPQLHTDDVSLRVDKGRLDVREISTLRRNKIFTITDLVDADLEALLEVYLPEVQHRAGAESRLRTAARRARMIVHDIVLERVTEGAIDLPPAELEIDFDIETTAGGLVYLWGFLIIDGGRPRYRAFSTFADLDHEAESELAVEALGWLRQVVESAGSVLIYHYSGFELAAIERLAKAHPDPALEWARDLARTAPEQVRDDRVGFVDLLETVKEHYFGADGLGLKVVARAGAGFAWRDDDPGGLNSQLWFAEAISGESPAQRDAARQRVLDYNEDDVRATAAVRTWLRTQS